MSTPYCILMPPYSYCSTTLRTEDRTHIRTFQFENWKREGMHIAPSMGLPLTREEALLSSAPSCRENLQNHWAEKLKHFSKEANSPLGLRRRSRERTCGVGELYCTPLLM